MEHTCFAHKGNLFGNGHSSRRNRNAHRLFSAILKSHGSFHILDIVLRERKHFFLVVLKITGRRTAAPVSNLEELIHVGTGVGIDIAITGNIAPCIQVRTGVDMNGASLHQFNMAIGTCRLAYMIRR